MTAKYVHMLDLPDFPSDGGDSQKPLGEGTDLQGGGADVTPASVTEKKVVQGLVQLARETGVPKEMESKREFIAGMATAAALIAALFAGVDTSSDTRKK